MMISLRPIGFVLTAAIVLALALMASLVPNPTLAASGPWQGGSEMQARLVTAIDSVADHQSVEAGLEVKLAPGWKIYWRSPGDAGLPPTLDFSKTPAIAGHEMFFPAPKRFSILGFDSFGYGDRVIYPLRLDLAKPGKGFDLAIPFEGLVCSDVCIPLRETLTLSLPKGDGQIAREARDIAQFKARVPRASTAAGVSLTRLVLDGDTLFATFEQGGLPLEEAPDDVLIEAASGFAFAAPLWQSGQAVIKVTGKAPEELIGQAVTVTAISPAWLLEMPAQIEAGVAANRSPEMPSSEWMLMIMVAFLGGVILNIMPCVLPVISLKLGAVMGQGGARPDEVRMSFLATAAGVIVSFLILGGVLLGLRQAGVAIGWGIQFQQPVFLTIAALAIALFGLVMLDLVRLPVPGFAQRWSMGRTGLMGDFIAGAMATILATPCSAPFVGTAIAFALTASASGMMMIFTAMGIGLALPWLAIAVFPKAARLLPKPGAWFVTLKRLLAAGLFATSAWLASVLITVVMGQSAVNDGWRDWQPSLAENLAQEGQVVFVDVTADWCLTCKANKALVLNTEAMGEEFAAYNTVMLKADWTAPDDRITAFLASHDRYGIPFNIVYGPGAPSGVVLPELLTASMVKDALAKAGAKAN
jgi:suppressor for copper-sensitivity B